MKKQFDYFEYRKGEEEQKVLIQSKLNDSQAYVCCGITDENQVWVECSGFDGQQLNAMIQHLNEHLKVIVSNSMQRN